MSEPLHTSEILPDIMAGIEAMIGEIIEDEPAEKPEGNA